MSKQRIISKVAQHANRTSRSKEDTTACELCVATGLSTKIASVLSLEGSTVQGKLLTGCE